MRDVEHRRVARGIAPIRVSLAWIVAIGCGEPTTPTHVGSAGDGKPSASETKTTAPETKTTAPGTKPAAVEAKAPSGVASTDPTKPVEPAPASDPSEIPVVAWSARPHEQTWTPQPAPTAVVAFEPGVSAGLVGRAGDEWLQLGTDGRLAAVVFDRAPTSAIVGVWPDDAWFVERRDREYGGGSPAMHELRLMKLREGKRWVPQAVRGEQWWHPGTEDELAPHMSTHTGMLVYPGSLASIDRIAGRSAAPVIGPHRGSAVDFVETNKGKVYVLSQDAGTYYAQIECADDACVAAMARRFPAGSWRFDRRVARGKFSVSVLARNEAAVYLLSNVGKDDGWRLDALASDGEIVGMWASAEGGLWTWNGTALRLRDTDGGWHDVALPEGVTPDSFAIAPDRRMLWLSGQANGAPALFTTPAQAPPP